MMTAERYEWLSNLKCNSMNLSRDESHSMNYTTATDWIENIMPDQFADVPPELLEAMKATNTIWQLQVYPDTPVGFYVWFGPTLNSVVDQAMRDLP